MAARTVGRGITDLASARAWHTECRSSGREEASRALAADAVQILCSLGAVSAASVLIAREAVLSTSKACARPSRRIGTAQTARASSIAKAEADRTSQASSSAGACRAVESTAEASR